MTIPAETQNGRRFPVGRPGFAVTEQPRIEGRPIRHNQGEAAHRAERRRASIIPPLTGPPVPEWRLIMTRRDQIREEPCFVISVAARMVGLHAQTLRYYERVGLIWPSRTVGRQRLYSVGRHRAPKPDQDSHRGHGRQPGGGGSGYETNGAHRGTGI